MRRARGLNTTGGYCKTQVGLTVGMDVAEETEKAFSLVSRPGIVEAEFSL